MNSKLGYKAIIQEVLLLESGIQVELEEFTGNYR